MNAQEARQKAKEVNVAPENSQYTKIKELISKAAEKGEYTARTYETLKPEVKVKLEREGFAISSYHEQRDGTIVTICW